jgi:CBS domain-containing protein
VSSMARTTIDEAAGLSVADVIHGRFTALPASATIGDVRDWFAVSTSRRMAFLVAGDRYRGSVSREHVAGDLDPARPATDVAQQGPTVLPDDPASHGQDVALQTAARRVPVVDGDGRLLGVVSVTEDLQAFCGTGETPTRTPRPATP